jgi:hypothetical protein
VEEKQFQPLCGEDHNKIINLVAAEQQHKKFDEMRADRQRNPPNGQLKIHCLVN